MEIGFIRIVSGRPYSIISKYTKFSLKNAKIFTFHYNLIAFDKKCAHSWLEMLTDNAFTNSCCIGTLVKKSLYLSGFHQRYCLGNKTYYNLNCTRLRYFCPVFCLIAVLEARERPSQLKHARTCQVQCYHFEHFLS